MNIHKPVELGKPVYSHIYDNLLWREFRNQTYIQLHNQLGNQLSNQLHTQLHTQLYGQIYFQLSDQLYIHLRK